MKALLTVLTLLLPISVSYAVPPTLNIRIVNASTYYDEPQARAMVQTAIDLFRVRARVRARIQSYRVETLPAATVEDPYGMYQEYKFRLVRRFSPILGVLVVLTDGVIDGDYCISVGSTDIRALAKGFSWSSMCGYPDYDLLTIEHELGHAYGADHDDDPNSLMNYVVSYNYSIGYHPVLIESSVAAIWKNYRNRIQWLRITGR